MQYENLPREKFVLHLNNDFPSQVKRIDGQGKSLSDYPLATVIIPTIDAYRNGYFPKLLEQIKGQSFQNFELIIVQADPRQGRAINTAASLARGKILIILDDDITFGHGQVLENLVKAIEGNPDIGMAGVANLIPQDATWFVKAVMKSLPRKNSDLVERITDSDMAEHPCCAIPKKIFYQIGGEREDVIRGLDPYLRQRIRSSGYRVVVIPQTWISHLPAPNFKAFLKYALRNGSSAGEGRRFSQEMPIEVPDGHVAVFVTRRGFFFRLVRFFWRVIYSLVMLNFLYFFYLVAFSLGFFYGRWIKKIDRINVPK